MSRHPDLRSPSRATAVTRYVRNESTKVIRPKNPLATISSTRTLVDRIPAGQSPPAAFRRPRTKATTRAQTHRRPPPSSISKTFLKPPRDRKGVGEVKRLSVRVEP